MELWPETILYCNLVACTVLVELDPSSEHCVYLRLLIRFVRKIPGSNDSNDKPDIKNN